MLPRQGRELRRRRIMEEQIVDTVQDEEVVACLLSERERAMRGDELGRELFAHVEAIEELADGYAYRFPAGEPR